MHSASDFGSKDHEFDSRDAQVFCLRSHQIRRPDGKPWRNPMSGIDKSVNSMVNWINKTNKNETAVKCCCTDMRDLWKFWRKSEDEYSIISIICKIADAAQWTTRQTSDLKDTSSTLDMYRFFVYGLIRFVDQNQGLGSNLIPPRWRSMVRSTQTTYLWQAGTGTCLGIRIGCLITYAQADCLDGTWSTRTM
jgi:hypothetical protein